VQARSSSEAISSYQSKKKKKKEKGNSADVQHGSAKLEDLPSVVNACLNNVSIHCKLLLEPEPLQTTTTENICFGTCSDNRQNPRQFFVAVINRQTAL
jgi:hypothetical protein